MKKIYFMFLGAFFMLSPDAASAQVGISTNTPNGALDITSTTDGLLIPRIALTNTTTATVITPTASELVYNTASVNDVTPGYYYWDGTKWLRLQAGPKDAWNLTGNAATTAANYVGTSDGVALKLATVGAERMRILTTGQVVVNNTGAPAATDRFSVYNTAATDFAINGYSTSTGVGVYGQNTATGYGVYGLNNSTGIAVLGQNLSTGAGVLGITNGAASAGVFGRADVAGGAGTYGTSNGAGAIGVFGNASANLSNGVYGQSSGTNGTGVYGYASNTGGDGVIGEATQAGRFGVYGINDNATGYGVYGDAAGATGYGVYGNAIGSGTIGVRGYSVNRHGMAGTSTSATGFGTVGSNTNASGTGLAGAGNNALFNYLTGGSGGAFTGTAIGSASWGTTVASGIGVAGSGNNQGISYFTAGSGGAFTGRQWGAVGFATVTNNDATDRAVFAGNYVSAGTTAASVYVGARIGNVHYKILGTQGGSVSTTMPTSQGERVLFAPEAPENWFFDIGEVTLVNGQAKVNLDPVFVECISDSKPFKVFVQGGENTLGSIRITRNQNDKSFVVEDLGGPSNGTVQYNVYAIWKGKDNLRLPVLNKEDLPKTMTARTIQQDQPEPASRQDNRSKAPMKHKALSNPEITSKQSN